MTIPTGHNSRLLKEKDCYQFFYCKPELCEVGITEASTTFGNIVRIYNKERTICDCIKKRDKLDSDLVLSALKRYASEQGNDHACLLHYAEIFKIRNVVKQYMEVLR